MARGRLCPARAQVPASRQARCRPRAHQAGPRLDRAAGGFTGPGPVMGRARGSSGDGLAGQQAGAGPVRPAWPGPALLAAVSRVTARPPGRSAGRAGAEQNAVPGRAPAARTRCRGRSRCGRPARRRAAGRRPGSAGGDGLAVAPAVGALGQAAAGPLDLADVGLPLAGMGREGEHRDVSCGGVQDEGDRAGLGVVTGQGGDPGPAVSGQAGSGALPPRRARAWAPASRVSARSIWSQAAPKFSPTGPRPVPRAMQYSILIVVAADSAWASRSSGR